MNYNRILHDFVETTWTLRALLQNCKVFRESRWETNLRKFTITTAQMWSADTASGRETAEFTATHDLTMSIYNMHGGARCSTEVTWAHYLMLAKVFIRWISYGRPFKGIKSSPLQFDLTWIQNICFHDCLRQQVYKQEIRYIIWQNRSLRCLHIVPNKRNTYLAGLIWRSGVGRYFGDGDGSDVVEWRTSGAHDGIFLLDGSGVAKNRKTNRLKHESEQRTATIRDKFLNLAAGYRARFKQSR